MMLWLLLLQTAEVKKGGERKIDGFRKMLMIPESEISKCPEFEVKSKIGNITYLWTKIYLKNILLRFIKLILIFMNIMEKIQVDENGLKYILSRIDVYFNEYLLAIEIAEKGHTDRDLIFEEKRQEALEKKLGCKFIRINSSNLQEVYDTDYDTSKIQTFIIKFKDRQLKKIKQKIKRTRRQNRKIDRSNHSLK